MLIEDLIIHNKKLIANRQPVHRDLRAWWKYKNVFAERPEQAEIFFDDSPNKVVVCGRRWGKSVLMDETAIHYAMTIDNAVCWIVGPNNPLARPVHWDKIKYRLEYLGYNIYARKDMPRNCTVHDASMHIELLNLHGGWSHIYVKSAVKEESLVGSGLDFLGIDEFRYLPMGLFEEQLYPSLTDRNGKLLITSTANGRDELYDLYMRGNNSYDTYIPGWKSWLYWTETNPYVPMQKVKEAQRTSPPKVFEQEYHCNFDTAQGLLYYNFDPTRHLKELEINYDLPLNLSFDFNFGLQTTTVSQIVAGDVEYNALKLKLKEAQISDNPNKEEIKYLQQQIADYPIKEQEYVINVIKTINTKNCWIDTHCENILKWLRGIQWTRQIYFYGDYTGSYRGSATPTNNWSIIKSKFAEYNPRLLLSPAPVEEVRYDAFNKKLLDIVDDEIGIYFNNKKLSEFSSIEQYETKAMVKDLTGIFTEADGHLNKRKWEKKGLTHNSDNLGYLILKEFSEHKKQPRVELLSF